MGQGREKCISFLLSKYTQIILVDEVYSKNVELDIRNSNSQEQYQSFIILKISKWVSNQI